MKLKGILFDFFNNIIKDKLIQIEPNASYNSNQTHLSLSLFQIIFICIYIQLLLFHTHYVPQSFRIKVNFFLSFEIKYLQRENYPLSPSITSLPHLTPSKCISNILNISTTIFCTLGFYFLASAQMIIILHVSSEPCSIISNIHIEFLHWVGGGALPVSMENKTTKQIPYNNSHLSIVPPM